MFDISKLILKIPNLLSSEECDLLIQFHKNKEKEVFSEACGHASTGVLTPASFKGVFVEPKTPEFNLIKEKTNQAINSYIQYLSSSGYFHYNLKSDCFKYSHQYRLLKYETGDKIHPHTDHTPYTYGSISFNLNEDYKGGELKFFNGKHSIKLNKGDVVIFPSDYFWVHEISPIQSGVRYSMNSFLTSHPYDLVSDTNEQIYTDEQKYLKNTPNEEILGPYC
jgi:predicted 2-oxoglutarate/Fe(II)-dependent dioxygenase YbiX